MSSDAQEDRPRSVFLFLIALLLFGGLSLLTFRLFHILSVPAPTAHIQH